MIKIVRSDRGRKYFGRYTEACQQNGPFACFLEQQDIVWLNIPPLGHHNIIGWQREGIEH